MQSQPRQAHRALPSIATEGDAGLIRVVGMIDEHFPGFGDLTHLRTAVIDASQVTYMTSFGVAKWLKAMAAVPYTLSTLYLAGCPPIFIDQLTMILNFSGRARIVSLLVPYTCTSCGRETNDIVDVVGRRDLPEQKCTRCGGKLALDAIADGYLTSLARFGASSVDPAIPRLLAADPSQLRAREITPEVAPRPAPVKAPEKTRSVPLLAVFVILAIAIAAAAYLLSPR